MPTMIPKFNWGTAIQEIGYDLYVQLSKAYSDTAEIVNTKVSKRVTSGQDAPASSQLNKNYDIGDIYVRTDTDVAWIMTSRTTATDVTWTPIT